MVISTTAANSTRTTGPRMMVNSLPCRTCAFRSKVAAQIHIAGRAWTSISRQFVTSRRSPLNSITNAPTARARGAKILLVLTSSRTAFSTLCSSFSRIAAMSRRTSCLPGWRGFRVTCSVPVLSTWPACLLACGDPAASGTQPAPHPGQPPGRRETRRGLGASAAYGCADGCVVCGLVQGFFVAAGFGFEIEDYFFHRASERVGSLVAVFGVDGHAVVAADVHACVEGEAE